MVCGSTTRLEVHHVVRERLGGSDDMDNLVTVCVLHHRQADAQLRRTSVQNRGEAELYRAELYRDDPERDIFGGPAELATIAYHLGTAFACKDEDELRAELLASPPSKKRGWRACP